MTTPTDPGNEVTRMSEHHAAADITVGSEQQGRALDRRIARERTEAPLNEALGETFPASDPVAVTSRKHDSK